MNDLAIEELADCTAAGLSPRDLTHVDPRVIAEREGIRLRGKYISNPNFDGMISYGRGRFAILYNTRLGENHARTRFSIAHELGHFYISSHRRFLRDYGQPHPSRSGFVSESQVEIQADRFAAALLLPRHRVLSTAQRIEPTLSEVEKLSDTFRTSLTATALRLVKMSHFCCAVVRSRGGRVDFAWISDEMKSVGLDYIPSDQQVMEEGPTAQVAGGKEERADELVPANHWFDSDENYDLYEEAMRLGRTGYVLTFLSLEETEIEEDVDLW